MLRFVVHALVLGFVSACGVSPDFRPIFTDSVFSALLRHVPDAEFKGNRVISEETTIVAEFGFLDRERADASLEVEAVGSGTSIRMIRGPGITYYPESTPVAPSFYRPGVAYRFSAVLASGERSSAIVSAPAASGPVDFDPSDPVIVGTSPPIKAHSRGADLLLQWPPDVGTRSFVSVYRGSATSGASFDRVYDSRPYQTGSDLVELRFQPESLNLSVPGAVFMTDGPYLVVLTTLEADETDADLDTAWAVSVGAASSVAVAVGDYRP